MLHTHHPYHFSVFLLLKLNMHRSTQAPFSQVRSEASRSSLTKSFKKTSKSHLLSCFWCCEPRSKSLIQEISLNKRNAGVRHPASSSYEGDNLRKFLRGLLNKRWCRFVLSAPGKKKSYRDIQTKKKQSQKVNLKPKLAQFYPQK